jgi:aminoglycoside 3-N-acetyltransferase
VVPRYFSYSSEDLGEALHAVGIESGDSVMVHTRFENHHGFRGSVSVANEAFLESVGSQGSLLMVSIPYCASASEYLRNLQCVDTNRTPSAMGLMSETFRQRQGVIRSAHPMHPVLAYGHRAEWFVASHELCRFPCGPGTPYDKLLEADGKVVFFNVPFGTFTFIHYLENRVSIRLDFPVHTESQFEARVIEREGKPLTVRTFAFSDEVIRRRRPKILEGWLRQRGLIRKVRVGASVLMSVDLKVVVSLVDEMAAHGRFFFADASNSK